MATGEKLDRLDWEPVRSCCANCTDAGWLAAAAAAAVHSTAMLARDPQPCSGIGLPPFRWQPSLSTCHKASLFAPQVRGLDGTKEASVVIKPHPEGPLHNKEAVTVNIAVANGLGERGGCCGGRHVSCPWVSDGFPMGPGGCSFSRPCSTHTAASSVVPALPHSTPLCPAPAGNAKKLLKQVQEGEKDYHFIEVRPTLIGARWLLLLYLPLNPMASRHARVRLRLLKKRAPPSFPHRTAAADAIHPLHSHRPPQVMACPGGCIGGGGQPRSKDKEILQKRQGALYKCVGVCCWAALLLRSRVCREGAGASAGRTGVWAPGRWAPAALADMHSCGFI